MRHGFLADREAAEALLRNMTELDFAEKKKRKKTGEEAEAVIFLFFFLFFPSANAIMSMSQPPRADLTGHGDLKTP